ncbi:hypothetical protein CUMW_162850 [Citrus unshiu]|uniref:Protein phosphatase inhibitor 2 n=1 Tax=Citrus unshiu TaxID=55188 RepID=A0A2H5PSB0_CITUN|nr:hypothetical protein CUMW_162850 [Citrus unshiu]
MIKGRVRWDEANLNEIEADKPVREKILEPKTPYHPMVDDDGFPSPALDSSDSSSYAYAAHAEAIRSALNKVAISEKHSRPFAGSSSSSEDEANEGDVRERRAMNFEDHRRTHYDEFKRVKELQKKANNSLLDDEDDYSDNEAGCNSSPSVSIGIRDIDIHSDDEILKTICIQGN